jgi:hypothetical protein
VGGFTDAPGRLVWAALGDPAFLPAPRGATWLPNRTSAVLEAPRGGLAVPGNARRPTPGTGALTPVDGGRRAGAKVTYRVRFGAFHDGARMSVADVLYAIGQPYRWAGPAEDGRHDATLAATTALLRERLVALRVTKIATEVRRDSDVEFVYDVPTIEVYLDRAPSEPLEAALVAPPWTTVPWHVAALMDEAARRGIAALSEAEATRRRVPWLDLVRDREVHAALAALVETFAREGFVPASLRGEVSVEEARTRWAALARFAGRHGHFLVTNGPYRLDRWSDDAVVLTVFRDLSYPLGVGHFDEYTIPLRAWVTRVEDRGDRLELSAEVETVTKFARSYEIVRAPLRAGSASQLEHLPVCRYVVIGPAGSVVRAGRAPLDARRVFRVDLRGLRPGRYAVLTVLEIDGNAVDAPVRSIEHHVRRR